MIPSGPDIALRAIGTALAGVSIAFAGYTFAFGDGKVHVHGIEHLAIFAQPRGPAVVSPAPPAPPAPPAGAIAVDMGPTGSVAETGPAPAPRTPEIVAARSDRVWLRIGAAIIAGEPGQEIPGVGRIGAIVKRGDGWAVLDDGGRVLLTLAGSANGAALFSRRLIFD